MAKISTAQAGEIVCWNVRAFVSRQCMVDALKREKIPVRVPKVTPATFLRRAIHECTSSGIIRIIGETAEEVSYAIVDEDLNLSSRKWEGRQKIAVVLNKQTGDIEFTRDTPLAQQIRIAVHEQEGGLTATEIGKTIQTVITQKAEAISLRETGGVYFVPQEHHKIIDRLERAFVRVAVEFPRAKVRIYRLPVSPTVRASQDISSLIHDVLDRGAETIVQEAIDASAMSSVRPCTFENRVSKLDQLIEKANTYERSVETSFANMRLKLKKAKREVIKLRIKSCRD